MGSEMCIRDSLNAMKDEIENPEKNKKLKDIQYDDFSIEQPYMNEKSVFIGRMAFKIRCKMLPGIPGNFKNKFRSKGLDENDGLLCVYCKEEVLMDQSHCMECSAWENLREGLDMTKILDMVKFFQLMLIQMEKKDDEKAMGQRDLHSTTPGLH